LALGRRVSRTAVSAVVAAFIGVEELVYRLVTS
jgi:hypothetical protein